MKLISLYIENFGGLSRYSLSFGNGLTVIEAENGFGKTTLAEFIRAMFYGFPRKAKTLDKSRRQKYMPWNGGKFGGNLIFETEGVVYRLERSFGATPKGDSFSLIDLNTGKKSSRFSEDIGLELFGLDTDAFERSTYLPQMAEVGSLTTDSIRSKLSNLVEDTNDVGNFEKAVAELKAKRSTYLLYRGSGGSVVQAQSRISLLQEQLHRAEEALPELESCGRSIDELETKTGELRAECDDIRIRFHRASGAAAVAAVHREYGRMQQRWEQARDDADRFLARYPKGIPDREAIEQAAGIARELENLGRQNLTDPEDLEAQRFLEENRLRFEEHIPSAEELNCCRSRCGELSRLREQMVKQAAESAAQPQIKASPRPLILLLIACLGELSLGAALLLDKNSFGFAALGIGAVTAVLCILAAVRLASQRKKLRQFQEEKMAAAEEMNRLTAGARVLVQEIREFLSAYGASEETDFYDALADLEHDAEDYVQAKSRVDRWTQEKKDHEAATERCRNALEGFFDRFGLTPQQNVSAQLLQIRDDRKDWKEALREMDELERELQAFREENSLRLAEKLPETAEDPVQLREKEISANQVLREAAEKLLQLQQEQRRLKDVAARIPELQEDLQLWQERMKADRHSADILDDTVAFLEQAKENLAVSYMGPIRKSFQDYLLRLWEDQPGQTLVNQDLDVFLERYGENRELGYFSAGQADLVMLCMRFALVDALFGEKTPCVILDDPFVNLDDNRTKQALELLKELSENRQILYLTCSSSRTPK